MKPNLLSVILTALTLSVFTLITSASTKTITGKLNGYNCANAGITCPIDPKDPHIALESDFVLQKGSGDYLFLTNISREVKLKYVLQDIQVSGKHNPKHESIIVDELRVKDGDTWKTAWSNSMVPAVNIETVSGKLNGHNCVHAGISCPLDPKDPHINLEKDFVLQQQSGDYLFLTNLPRSTKLQYVLQDIQVSGKMDRKYNTIEVYKLMVMEDDEWKTVWIKKE